MNSIWKWVVGASAALLLANSTVYVVDQTKYAVVYSMGEIKEVLIDPGLKLKWPRPFQNVVFLDKRVQSLESPDTLPIYTAEKKNLVVDWMVKWRITDARQFIRTAGLSRGNESLIGGVDARLSSVVQTALNEEVTKRTIKELLSSQRDQVMQDVRKRLVDSAKQYGIEVVDVRIRRVDFAAGVSDSVYSRMASERKRVANELRAKGQAEADTIRADAERQVEVIVSEAYRDAQLVRGEGDASATAIYNQAFGKDPQFAKFYRSLTAYRESFHQKGDVVVVDGSQDFFRVMREGGGGAAAGGKK